MSGYRIRYAAGTPAADKFATIRYPWPWKPPYDTPQRAEAVIQSMPWPERWEICEDGQ